MFKEAWTNDDDDELEEAVENVKVAFDNILQFTITEFRIAPIVMVFIAVGVWPIVHVEFLRRIRRSFADHDNDLGWNSGCGTRKFEKTHCNNRTV